MPLGEYLKVFRERWLLVVAGLVLGVVAAGAVTLLTPKQYSSSITIYVSADTAGENPQTAYQGGLLSEQRVTSYTQLLTGDRIAREVAARLGPGVSPGEVRRKISATARPNSVLLTATVVDRSPESAAQVANAVGDAFTGLVDVIEQPRDRTRPPAVTVQVVEPAQPVDSPVAPRPAVNLGLGAVLGLLLGIGAAFARNALDTTVKSVAGLRELVDAPNLGVIADDPAWSEHPLISQDDPHAPRAEAFRQIRTNLRFLGVDRPRKVFVVSSAMPEEGKTTTACNLALALAEAGVSVALVEGDLRRPRTVTYLGLERAVGLTNVLTHRVPLDDALQPWGDGVLQVLACGPIPPNPSELLSSQQMSDVLDELGRRFEVVLVDAPPLLPVTDAAAVAVRCDGVLLVVRHGRTTSTQLRSAVTALDAVGAQVVGTVLTMAPVNGPRAYAQYTSYYRSDPPSEPGAAQAPTRGRTAEGRAPSASPRIPDPRSAVSLETGAQGDSTGAPRSERDAHP